MSVLSRHRIPTPRVGHDVIDLDAPSTTRTPTTPAAPAAPAQRPAAPTAPTSSSARPALLLAAGALVIAAGVSAGVYVVMDDDSATPSTPATQAEITSEARRDAAAAARNSSGVAASEAQRDANAAARFAAR